MLPARVAGYDPRWLDELCLSGEVAWGRLTPRSRPGRTRRSTGDRSSRSAGIGHAVAGHPAGPGAARGPRMAAGRGAHRRAPEPSRRRAPSADVLARPPEPGRLLPLRAGPAAGRLPAEVDEGLWDLVARGMVTADAFSAVRSLLSARERWRARQRRAPGRPGGPRPAAGRGGHRHGEGRWSFFPGADDGAIGRPGDAVRRRRTSWPRRWPASCWPGGAWWPGSCGTASRSACPGARWSGPCAASRPGGWSSGAGSWPGSRASSTPLPEAAELLADVRGAGRGRCRGDGGRRRPAQPDRDRAPGPRVPAVRHRRVDLPRRRATKAG